MAREHLKGAGHATLASLGALFAQSGEKTRKERDKAYSKYADLLENPAYALKPGAKYKKGNTIPQVIELFEYHSEFGSKSYQNAPLGEERASLHRALNPDLAEYITSNTTLGDIKQLQASKEERGKTKRFDKRIVAREELVRIKDALKDKDRAIKQLDLYLSWDADKRSELLKDDETRAAVLELIDMAGFKFVEKPEGDWTIGENIKSIVPGADKPEILQKKEQVPVQPTPIQQPTAVPQPVSGGSGGDDAKIKTAASIMGKHPKPTPQMEQELDAAMQTNHGMDPNATAAFVGKYIKEIRAASQQFTPTGVTDTPGGEQQLKQSLQQPEGQTGVESPGLLPRAGVKNRLKAMLLRAQTWDPNKVAMAGKANVTSTRG